MSLRESPDRYDITTTGCLSDDAAPHQLASADIHDALSEGMHVILVEATRYYEYKDGSDMILQEHAGHPNFQTIQEAVFDTTRDMVTKFFKQCESIARGVIARLKEFSYKLTMRTEDWLRVVQPRVEKVKQTAGWENLTANIYPWDPAYLESGVCQGIKKLHMSWSGIIAGVSGADAIFRKASALGQGQSDTGEQEQDPNQGIDTSELDGMITGAQNQIAEFEDRAVLLAGQAFGVPMAQSIDDVWAAVVVKAHGGAREPGYTYGRDIDRILATLVNSNSLVDETRKVYEEHAKALKDYADRTKAALLSYDPASLGTGDLATKANSAIKVNQQLAVRVTESIDTMMSKANSLNIALIQKMMADYMRCVNLFVAYKGPGTTTPVGG